MKSINQILTNLLNANPTLQLPNGAHLYHITQCNETTDRDSSYQTNIRVCYTPTADREINDNLDIMFCFTDDLDAVIINHLAQECFQNADIQKINPFLTLITERDAPFLCITIYLTDEGYYITQYSQDQ